MGGRPKGIPGSNLWAFDPNGINQVGCVYTAQVFEFDYAGVIFGPDLIYNFDAQDWEGHPEGSSDRAVKRSKGRFLDLAKNTYRVLLSRALKGCYVHFMDKDTERFFRSRMEGGTSAQGVERGSEPTVISVGRQSQAIPFEPFRRLPIEEVRPFVNCVPL